MTRSPFTIVKNRDTRVSLLSLFFPPSSPFAPSPPLSRAVSTARPLNEKFLRALARELCSPHGRKGRKRCKTARAQEQSSFSDRCAGVNDLAALIARRSNGLTADMQISLTARRSCPSFPLVPSLFSLSRAQPLPLRLNGNPFLGATLDYENSSHIIKD